MSESDGSSVWVGDLDRCISIDFDHDNEIDRANEKAAERQFLKVLKLELEEIGDLELLAGNAISARQLYEKNIAPSVWRHALHRSEMTIGSSSQKVLQHEGEGTNSPVTRFVKGMLDLGRPYAIARYARWERLDYPSALTATLPHGISALVNQLLASEGITRSHDVAESIRAVLGSSEMGGMTAYRRTGLLQAALHRVADETPTHPGGTKLDRNMMRAILALARLHFSTIELRLGSFDELRSLLSTYEAERAIAQRDDARITTNGRLIDSWRLRHIQPLLNLYPYSIRHGLKRALEHEIAYVDRTALVNELALAHCGIFRMRATGQARTLARAK